MSKKILFLTTLNLATNPRIAKEIELAVLNNYTVEVICFKFKNWSSDFNHSIIKNYPQVNFYEIDAGKDNLFLWMSSIITEKGFRFLSRFIKLNSIFNSFALTRRSNLLIKEINKIKEADIIIGHNPGTIYAVIYASNKLKAKAGFDIEDYHPGEGNNMHMKKILMRQMKSLLPKMNYISFASPLIMTEIKKDIYFNENQKQIEILNYYSKNNYQLDNDIGSNKITLVWFSQNIDFNRGLEQVLPILEKYKHQIELHLYGNMASHFEKFVLKYNDFIEYHGTIESSKLHKELIKHDIGLAIEPGKDLNNILALSNKILSYYQSGLYILATDTLAQSSFLEEHPNHGIQFDKEFKNLEETILKVINDISIIREEKKNRFYQSQNFNWETASLLLLKTWEAI